MFISKDADTETIPINPKIAISMKNVSARWVMPSNDHFDNFSKENTLESDAIQNGGIRLSVSEAHDHLSNLNIEFVKGQLIGVIGPVGAGKSSMLQAILRELPLDSGSININGSISFVSQEPWLFAASVRQNILFGEKYDHERYRAVIRSCALDRDFEQFENGDLTIVGERGASLSGGQKARIK